MNGEFPATALGDIMRELEETVEKANLLALEMALRSLEEGLAGNAGAEAAGAVELASCAAQATEEFERLVRRLQAA